MPFIFIYMYKCWRNKWPFRLGDYLTSEYIHYVYWLFWAFFLFIPSPILAQTLPRHCYRWHSDEDFNFNYYRVTFSPHAYLMSLPHCNPPKKLNIKKDEKKPNYYICKSLGNRQKEDGRPNFLKGYFFKHLNVYGPD